MSLNQVDCYKYLVLELESVKNKKRDLDLNTVKFDIQLELEEKYLESQVMYTDGAKSVNGGGAAFYVPTNKKKGTMRFSKCFKTSPIMCIMSSELIAISEALSNVQLKLQWIPSHVGLKGNEEADILAKRGITEGQEMNILPCYSEFLFKYKLKCAQMWDEYFDMRSREKGICLRFPGVPFTAKESHAVKGLVNSLGIIARRHTRAPEDAECVRLVREKGAIPVAITNVPEINKWQETRNMLYGQTNNPYHTGRTTGGSSGGEAALAAALASPISLCSDIGGSTRMPAFYCGLYALNPTAGYTSLKGSALRSGLEPTMASIGFVSKHCEDLAPLTKIVLADNAKEFDFERKINVKDVKFFYTESAQDLRVGPVCKDLRKAMSEVIKKLTEEAPSTDKVPMAYYHEGFDHMFSIWKHGMSKEADSFPKMLANNNGEAKAFVELGKKLIGQSQFTMAAIMKLFDDQVLPQVNAEWAEKLTNDLKNDLIKTLGTDGVLLFPSAPRPAPYHYSLLLRPFSFAYWGVFNALHCPAAQVPLGLNSDGIPLGLQVVAAPKQEALCLAVADHLGKTFGGYVPPCQIYS
ncbi:fatty-acid amide hydrolase 2-like [Hyposmocoma kahamanoa]|uniref:fatty-acid amide hydrolase 2-like n=1 Tax=Hyposmocoma kahamanoa TaxID=1477025 RepID=UPI000E6D6DA3|nr:fatty-acid amide hydrolase 2-like [Hyposmocoma kahamanoa]